MKNRYSAPTIAELLPEHEATHDSQPKGQILEFNSGIPGYDVYNAFPPFEWEGNLVSIARVEPHATEGSVSKFFRRNGSPNVWDYDDSLPTMPWEDPFYNRIGDQWIFGGVRIHQDKGDWRTELSIVSDPTQLAVKKQPDLVGPWHMKNMGPVILDNEFAGMFTRPIDSRYPKGKAGFLAVRDAVQISPLALANAPIIDGFIAHEANEWGGITAAYDLGNKQILAAMHLARFTLDGLSKQYYGGKLRLDLSGNRVEVLEQKIISCRHCFPDAPVKPSKVHNLGPVAILRGFHDGQAYHGISDTSVGRLSVVDQLPSEMLLAA